MWTKQDAAVAAAYRVDVQRWAALFDGLMDTVGSRFARPEPRCRESFQGAKTGLGLDQHQHRRWKAWHRWTTLIIEPARRIADVIAWSIFRRRHQAAAKTKHYERQKLTEP
ncbi:hypothetical protein [Micromonospora echinospora]|uniref:hypothetical protein n=1 Tax=Micromonospora echinospora TaxID=1877 RepID=UPI003A898630